MQETPEHLAIAELTERAGVTPRTVRYYVAEGLLRPPSGSGQNRTYSSEHLVRLAAIKRLKEAYLQPAREASLSLSHRCCRRSPARPLHLASPRCLRTLSYL